MNFYKHHLGDYDGATAHLSWEEDLAYRRLLSAYYRREAPLPKSPGEVFRLVRATTKAQKSAVSTVLVEFFEELADGWHQKRCDEEIKAYQHQASTNRRTARQRFVNDSSTNRVPNQKPEPDKDKKPPAKDAGPLWSESLTILTESGISEKSARAFIGGLCRDYSEDDIVDAVRSSMGKADRPAYIRGVLRAKPKKGAAPILKVAMP